MGIEAWIDEVTPDRREIAVCFDRRLVSELVSADRELVAMRTELDERGKMLQRPQAEADLAARVEELKAAILEKTRTFVFEGIGWGPWRDLIAKHPPAPDQSSTFARAVQLAFMPHAVENVGYNAETFIPAAIAASCVEPGMSFHEAGTLLRKAPPGIIERVWAAVLESNLAGDADPFVFAASEDSSDEAAVSTTR